MTDLATHELHRQHAQLEKAIVIHIKDGWHSFWQDIAIIGLNVLCLGVFHSLLVLVNIAAILIMAWSLAGLYRDQRRMKELLSRHRALRILLP